MRVTRALLIVLLTAAATPAAAQSHYIGASLVGDVARFSRVEIAGENPAGFILGDPPGDGEALGGGLALGTALGDRWGIEFEFVRPAVIEDSTAEGFPPLSLPIPATFPIPIFEVQIFTEQRHTTFGAMAWIRQEITPRFDLVYLGGVTFSHVALTRRYRVAGDNALLAFLTLAPNTRIDDHGVGPALGVEGRWKLARHVSIVPGLRLHGVSVGGRPGWLFRPSAGVRWRF